MTEELNPSTEEQINDTWKTYCMSMCREHRDKLLSSTDYIHMPDVDISDERRQILVEYRQELRDFPSAFSDIFDSMTEDEKSGVTPQSIPFPEKPE